MYAMDLRTLRALRFFSPERCADQHADREADGQPHPDVSRHYTEDRA